MPDSGGSGRLPSGCFDGSGGPSAAPLNRTPRHLAVITAGMLGWLAGLARDGPLTAPPTDPVLVPRRGNEPPGGPWVSPDRISSHTSACEGRLRISECQYAPIGLKDTGHQGPRAGRASGRGMRAAGLSGWSYSRFPAGGAPRSWPGPPVNRISGHTSPAAKPANRCGPKHPLSGVKRPTTMKGAGRAVTRGDSFPTGRVRGRSPPQQPDGGTSSRFPIRDPSLPGVTPHDLAGKGSRRIELVRMCTVSGTRSVRRRRGRGSRIVASMARRRDRMFRLARPFREAGVASCRQPVQAAATSIRLSSLA
jgi:hypothetical protein